MSVWLPQPQRGAIPSPGPWGISMTARYRCPWCSTFRGTAMDTRKHILERHRALLIMELSPIEIFGIHVRELTHSRYSTERLRTNPGVSGEGDSS